MKQTRFANGSIPTADDFDFTERSKQYAIEQTRFDILAQKGVLKDSGESSGHATDPLRVYLTGEPVRTVNIYSGIVYDAFEKRSRRIWVPDIPTNIPLNPAAAVSNHGDIDMPDEVQTKDFDPAFRPPRTSLKTFDLTVATGYYYVSIRYDTGTYDPITIESDGSQEDSKWYETYIIVVSTSTAVQLTASTGVPHTQLGTVHWSGLELVIDSDDREFCNATVTLTEEAVAQHQNWLHENCIISENHTLLTPTINNAHPPKVALSNTIFGSTEGILINGERINQITSDSIDFESTMASDRYYLYIDSAGNPRATTSVTIAENNCILGDVYYDQGTDQLRMALSITEEVVRDKRAFGAIGNKQISTRILGDSYDYNEDMKIKEMSDGNINHRQYTHQNGIIMNDSNGVVPYTAGNGSFGASLSGADSIVINELTSGDILSVRGSQCTSRWESTGTIDFTGETAGNTYYIYAHYASHAVPVYPRRYQLSVTTYNPPVTNGGRYPICSADWDGSVLTNLTDLRVFGTIGYWQFQKNSNPSGYNTLPQPLTSVFGVSQIGVGGAETIYITDDWGVAANGGDGGLHWANVRRIRLQV